eukprot:1159561-Pelagomonas_calceolata.AAC.5
MDRSLKGALKPSAGKRQPFQAMRQSRHSIDNPQLNASKACYRKGSSIYNSLCVCKGEGGVTITQQGDTAGDLLIIADGNLSVAPPSSAATDPHGKNPSMGGPSMGGFNASEHGSMSVDVSTALPRMDSVSANTTSIKQRDSAMSYSGALANTTSIKQLDSAMIDSSNKMARFGGKRWAKRHHAWTSRGEREHCGA